MPEPLQEFFELPPQLGSTERGLCTFHSFCHAPAEFKRVITRMSYKEVTFVCAEHAKNYDPHPVYRRKKRRKDV